MTIYNTFGKLLCFGYSLANAAWKIEGEALTPDPAVYVVHHQNMFGPVHTIGLLPKEAHMWSLHCFVDKKKTFDQYYNYTFLVRYGWSKPISYVVAKVLSIVVPLTLRSLRVIPVYHDATSVKTMRDSLDVLGKGESIVICPDVDYASTSPFIGKMYPGFFMLGRSYCKRTNTELPFIPLYCSKTLKKIVVGPAYHLDCDAPYNDARDDLENQLASWINQQAVECGDHLLEV